MLSSTLTHPCDCSCTSLHLRTQQRATKGKKWKPQPSIRHGILKPNHFVNDFPAKFQNSLQVFFLCIFFSMIFLPSSYIDLAFSTFHIPYLNITCQKSNSVKPIPKQDFHQTTYVHHSCSHMVFHLNQSPISQLKHLNQIDFVGL